MAKVFTISALPDPKRRQHQRRPDHRYIEGQRLLVGAMKYLAKADRRANQPALHLLSEHFRTQFRMEDRPS